MAIYHISADGVARRCCAQDPYDCRVRGSSIEHYNTREEAQTAYEKSQEKDLFFKLSKNPTENTERHYKNISDDNNPIKKMQKAARDRYENASAEEKARIDKARERYKREREEVRKWTERIEKKEREDN